MDPSAIMMVRGSKRARAYITPLGDHGDWVGLNPACSESMPIVRWPPRFGGSVLTAWSRGLPTALEGELEQPDSSKGPPIPIAPAPAAIPRNFRRSNADWPPLLSGCLSGFSLPEPFLLMPRLLGVSDLVGEFSITLYYHLQCLYVWIVRCYMYR